MGHEVNVGGVVQTIKYGEANVGGTVQTIKYGEANVSGVVQTLPFGSEETAFADTPWSEIVAICEAVYNEERELPDNWQVGDNHPFKIYDSADDAEGQTENYTEYEVVVIGMHHDEGADNYCPLTLQLKECFAERGTMEAEDPDSLFAYSYAQTKMHLTTLPSILERIDPDVRDYVRYAHKYADVCEGELEEFDAYGLFLLNAVEVFDASAQADVYSQQYEYYASGASAVKTRDGEACDWWLSNATDAAYYYAYVGADGSRSDSGRDSVSRGISFAFCL